MQLSFALNCAFTLGLMGSSSAFTLPLGTFVRTATKIHTGTGWDNDEFLDSLSPPGGPADAGPSREEVKLPPQTGGQFDVNQGGTRFQDMMSKAKNGAPAPRQEEASAMLGPYVPPAAPAQAVPNMEGMSVEDQAAMFRQMMQMSGQQGEQSGEPVEPMPKKSFGPMGLDDKGRKVGRNRDADTIANTSDLYFAQLKRDSSVRTMARYSGDEEYAEQIFVDSGVTELKATYKENPYLQAERDAEQKLFAQAQIEMREFAEAQERKVRNVNDTGPKYKELLARKKAGKAGAVVATVVATPAPAPVVQEVPAPVPVPVVQEPVVQAPVPVPVSVVAEIPVTSSKPVTETEQTRRKLRELQGLFLKHRGGPGFGSGRLRANEVAKFEEVLKEVGGALRAEAGDRTANPAAVAPVVPAPVVVVPTAPMAAPAVISPPAVASTDEASTMEATLACVQGAVQMYKNSPPEMQQGILPMLQAALVSAANSCTEVIGSPPAAASAGSADMEGTLACVEGAVQMYKNSPPEMQQGILPMLRAALLSAASSCTPGEEPVVVAASPTPESVLLQQETTSSSDNGNDSNSVLLQKVYDGLVSASGGGKFGLGPISSEEGSDLTDLVHEMRGVLMEELDSGIPDDGPAVAASEPEGSTSSLYQQMLAKARAAKENK